MTGLYYNPICVWIITSECSEVAKGQDESEVKSSDEILGGGTTNDTKIPCGSIVGEIHAHTPPIIALRHLLTDTTIAVHPAVQGQGVGRKLFEHFLHQTPPSIARVELYTRETNTRNFEVYKRLGFVSEGPQRHKICMPDRQLQTPVHMVWFNPNFDIDAVARLASNASRV
jgi:GNAT superfamily N-acetyltransferase